MLQGGSKGQRAQDTENAEGTSYGSFFHNGIPSYTLSRKHTTRLRILPAFDMNLNPKDDAFDTSYVSYRDVDAAIDPDTETAGFTDWFFIVRGYTYWGVNKRRFLSPLTGVAYFPAGYDPIRDCWKYIDQNVSDPEIKKLAHGYTEVGEDGKERKMPGYLLKTPREFALMNALVHNVETDEWEPKVVIATISALRDFKEKLSLKAGRADNIVTPKWEEFYYGDITDPETGCIVVVKDTKIGTTNTAGLHIDIDKSNSETNKRIPMKVDEDQLKQRFQIFDTDHVTCLPDRKEGYQHILDILLEEGVVPFDILKKACGNYGKVDESKYNQNGGFEKKQEVSTSAPTKNTSGFEKAKEVKSDVTPSVKQPEVKKEVAEDNSKEKGQYEKLKAKLVSDDAALTPEELTEFATLASKFSDS